ncbi:MAG TPA: hypothetical protein VF783_25560 [Terriglobales bacterium]
MIPVQHDGATLPLGDLMVSLNGNGQAAFLKAKGHYHAASEQ